MGGGVSLAWGSDMFKGKSAFVTGGGTGNGFACGEAIVGRRTEVLAAAAEALGERAKWVQCDVTSTELVDEAIATAVERSGPLGLAVNSAFQAMVGSILGTPPDLFAFTTEGTLNCRRSGTFRALQAEARAMVASGGAIVNISSVAAARSGRWEGAYSASKAAIDMLTRVAADELGHYGIRVNSVLPGLIATENAAPLTDNPVVREGFVRQTPLKRLGAPEDVARCVAFLLSDDASFITGQCVGVDGGLVLRGLPEPEHGNVLRHLAPDFFADMP